MQLLLFNKIHYFSRRSLIKCITYILLYKLHKHCFYIKLHIYIIFIYNNCIFILYTNIGKYVFKKKIVYKQSI